MRWKYSWVWGLLVGGILLSGCEASEPLQTPVVHNTSSGLPSPTVNLAGQEADPTFVETIGNDQHQSAPLSFRGKLTRLSMDEQSNQSSSSLQSWDSAALPREPIQISHHWEEVSISILFSEVSEEELAVLLEQIRVSGEKLELARNERHPNQFRFTLAQTVGASFVLQLGDLPPITVERKTSLSFKPVTASGLDDPKQLLIRALEYGTNLWVPMDEQFVTLEFSEDMLGTLPTELDESPPSVHVEWIDNRHLRIGLVGAGDLVNNEARQVNLRFDRLESTSGNQLHREQSFHILRTPSVTWRDGTTGEVVGGGPRDRYYEQLIFSQNRQQYIGVLSLGGSMGDGDGWSYAFVLERDGKPPVVVEELFYSTVEPNNAPIGWTDSNTIGYSSYYGIYSFDTDKMIKRTIIQNDEDERRNINYATWDAYRNRLYALAFEDRGSSSITNVLTFTDKAEPDVRLNFSETVLVGKYSYLDLSIIPTAKAVYWTRTEQGVPVTDYVADIGTVFTARGVARLAAPDGIYLQRYSADEKVDKMLGEQIVQPDGWWYWKPGQDERRIADPPRFLDVFVSGTELISRGDGESYYRYDPKRDEWVIWKAVGGQVNAEPIRGPDGLYRLFQKPL